MRFYRVASHKEAREVADVILSLNYEPPLSIKIDIYKNKRSLNQNALYWKWVDIIANETGHNVEYTHNTLRAKFLGFEYIPLEGEVIKQIKSTTKLTTKEMGEYMTQIEIWAADFDIQLPTPAWEGF